MLFLKYNSLISAASTHRGVEPSSGTWAGAMPLKKADLPQHCPLSMAPQLGVGLHPCWSFDWLDLPWVLLRPSCYHAAVHISSFLCENLDVSLGLCHLGSNASHHLPYMEVELSLPSPQTFHILFFHEDDYQQNDWIFVSFPLRMEN